ncbi:hypothetical protein FA13DRAFT_1797390 [Coprinellus micaceus]|uniref:Uncharacterized protein n=1 Tax=Coprinellus micaceus TaxID=71717 RepID=A0A4Y7SQV4_COPMI|nr:hypothetical protein FA13DRAFT_1797390 [Coprinellus micaceus]
MRVGKFKAAQTFLNFFTKWPNQDSEEYEALAVKLTKKGQVSKQQPRSTPHEVKKFETTEDCKCKIQSWFYNHTAKGHGGKVCLRFNINIGMATQPKVLSEENLYSKQYYAQHVKAKVDAELKDVGTPTSELPSPKTPATKVEIQDLCKKLVREKKVADELIKQIFSDEQNPDGIEPEGYLLTQECLDKIIDEVLNLIAIRTGWAVSLNMGGPDMSKMNGDTSVKMYHVGYPRGNRSFWTNIPQYDEVHAKPFHEWCQTFFSHGCLIYVDAMDIPEKVAARESDDEGNDENNEAKEEGDKIQNGAPEEKAGEGDDNNNDTETVQMEWIIENGVPVPIFVEKRANHMLTPENPPLPQEHSFNNQQPTTLMAHFTDSTPFQATTAASTLPIGQIVPFDNPATGKMLLFDPELTFSCTHPTNMTASHPSLYQPLGIYDNGMIAAMMGSSSSHGPCVPNVDMWNLDRVRTMLGMAHSNSSILHPTVEASEAYQSDDLPDWINEARKHLKVDMEHKGWLKLVGAWYEFETVWATTGMSQSGCMQAQKCPPELGPWLQAPHQYNVVPKISDIHVFANQWLQWWMAIQSGCRKENRSEVPKPLEKAMDIMVLKKGGALGIVVILIGLCWWGMSEELSDRWEQAVEDVVNVFHHFTNVAT